MMRRYLIILFFAVAAVAYAMAGDRNDTIPAQSRKCYYSVSAIGAASTGDFAPYLLGSLNYGRLPYKYSALLDAVIVKPFNLSRRFSYGFGVEAVGGSRYANEYARWNETDRVWSSHRVSPDNVWIQQLYAEIKYRGVFLTAGYKEYAPPLVNLRLSSGDLVESGNARPIPQVRAGFVDFQNIPFTKGHLQIQGEISYGRMADNSYMKEHYNYYNYHIALNQWYVYKRCFFRTDPRCNFSVTVGMQAGSYFGGKGYYYNDGKLIKERKFASNLGSFVKMWLPLGENGETYYVGGTLGTWDFNARYRFRDGSMLKAYFQWLWEDGSGIGKQNGWDGLWGLELKINRRAYLEGFVFEYLEFRNQSGAIHFDPDDHAGTDIVDRVTGEDNYYNQGFYNSWANYGMALGSPAFKAPIYNLDGFPAFTCNRFSGVHIGAEGHLSNAVSWRGLFSWQRGLGRYTAPYYKPRFNRSMLLELKIDASRLLSGLGVTVQGAYDRGDLRGNSLGGMLSVSYTGRVF